MRTLRIIAIVVALVSISCDTIASVSNPSALDIEERKAEIQAKTEVVGQMALSVRGKGNCDEIISQAVSREEVLDNALLTSIVVSDGTNAAEMYDILGKKLDFLNDLERDLKTCADS